MTYESRGALASHVRERDKLLLRCRCGSMYETRAEDPAEWCPACRKENLRLCRKNRKQMQKDSREANAALQWSVEYDSCAYPMKAGAKLSADEVEAGVRLGTFALGTRLAKRGRTYVVTASGLV